MEKNNDLFTFFFSLRVFVCVCVCVFTFFVFIIKLNSNRFNFSNYFKVGNGKGDARSRAQQSAQEHTKRRGQTKASTARASNANRGLQYAYKSGNNKKNERKQNEFVQQTCNKHAKMTRKNNILRVQH